MLLKPYIKMARDETKEYNLAINEFKELVLMSNVVVVIKLYLG